VVITNGNTRANTPQFLRNAHISQLVDITKHRDISCQTEEHVAVTYLCVPQSIE